MNQKENIQRSVYFVLALLCLSFLAWNAVTLKMEYYDGIQYLVSGLGLVGAPWKIIPKNIQMTCLTGAGSWLSLKLGIKPDLTFFHLLFFSFSLLTLFISARCIKRFQASIPFFAIVGLGACNRLFVHYSSFCLPDILCALWVTLWFNLEFSVGGEKKKEVYLKAILLTMMATNRPHLIAIPLTAIVWRILQERKSLIKQLSVIFLSLVFYLITFAIFFCFVFQERSLQSVGNGFQYFFAYAGDVNKQANQPAYVYLEYLQKSLTWAGIVLLLIGVCGFWQSRKSLPQALKSLTLGSFFYFVLLLGFGQKEARYLLPLMPCWMSLQCLGLSFLEKQKKWLGFACVLLLFESVVPEYTHFLDPLYRSNFLEESAARIAAWSKTKHVVLVPEMAGFHPKEAFFHWNDKYFYIYHWWGQHLNFFSGISVEVRGEVHYSQYGYPIPDGIEGLAPSGTTIVVPSPTQVYTGTMAEFNYPIFALRWFPLSSTDLPVCDARVQKFCVELFQVFPRK